MTAATGREIDAISRCLGKQHRIADDGYTAWHSTCKNKEVLTVQTGIGRVMVERALNPILAAHQANTLISIGFGGALTAKLGVGDLVVCTSVVPHDGADGGPLAPYVADERLVKCAAGAVANLKCLLGKGVTVARLASNAVEKRALRDKVGAEVCEMEDYWVARAASARKIPFLAVRVVYDELNTMLPDYESMVDRNGNVRLGATTSHILTHPGQLFNAWAAYRNYSRAKDSLSTFLERFLDVL
jgi:adenosylhomocysteine nucleosidase